MTMAATVAVAVPVALAAAVAVPVALAAAVAAGRVGAPFGNHSAQTGLDTARHSRHGKINSATRGDHRRGGAGVPTGGGHGPGVGWRKNKRESRYDNGLPKSSKCSAR